jgi:hypothetical protein
VTRNSAGGGAESVDLTGVEADHKIWADTGWEDLYREGGGRKIAEKRHKTMRIYAGKLLSGNVGKTVYLGEKYNEAAYKRLEAHLKTPIVMKDIGKTFTFGDFLRVIKGAGLGYIYVGGGRNRAYTVSKPISKAGNILARITHDVPFIPKYSGQPAGRDHFYSILHHLLDFLHLKIAPGSSKKDLFEQFNTDDRAQLVISRLMLQYFFDVWRQWFNIENALQISM